MLKERQLRSMSVLRLCCNKFSGKVPHELVNQFFHEKCFDLSNLCSDTTKVNRKTDVYSFGVVLLELTTGREAVTYGDHMNLAERAHLHYKDTSNVIDVLNDEIKDSIYLDQCIAVFRLGVFCTASSPSNRPCMKDCLHILQNYEKDSF